MADVAEIVGNGMDFIDLKTQYRRLREPINRRIQDVLDHGQFVLGAEVEELEERLAGFVGSDHCVSVASGTDALLIALMALEVGRGDEVITPPFTFIATAEAIVLLGATPVFVDIDRRTYNIDPNLIEAAITERTRAIMPVSLFGQCADFDRINEIGGRHGIAVIEDAAQSLGAAYKERHSCALTSLAAASFYPSKPLGCYGEGGAVFADEEDLAQVARELRVHGQDRGYHHVRVGLNGRMDTLQAAILLAKLEVFEDELNARQRVAQRYGALIEEVFAACAPERAVRPPYVEPHNRSVFAQYTIEVPDRAAVREFMSSRGIPTAVHYPVPLHRQPAYAAAGAGRRFPMAEEVAQRVVSLPMHAYLEEGDQHRVVTALRDALTRA